MRLEFCQDCRQRPDSERHVPRNGDVVLSVTIGCQPKVTAGLTRRVISEPRQASSQVVARHIARQSHGVISSSRTTCNRNMRG